MNTEQCRRYLEDPEAHSGHLSECAECRAVSEELGARVETQPVRVESLPLAPWEGAGYRSWRFVLAVGVMAAALAAALFASAQASPIAMAGEGIRASVAISRSLVGVGSAALEEAPVVIILSFIVVNGILLALLRRAPKGIDV